jgi:hypothetical protein
MQHANRLSSVIVRFLQKGTFAHGMGCTSMTSPFIGQVIETLAVGTNSGISTIETTNAYVEIDLEMKHKTLQSCEELLPKRVGRPSVRHRLTH